LITHQGPILTCANWSGTWPGLVGMLNLNGCLTKANVKYSTIWSEDFTDAFFRDALQSWLTTGKIKHKTPHVTKFKHVKVRSPERKLGESLANQLQCEKAILGVFDEGCMGMFNAIIPDELLHPTGAFKERLSQSALYYETTQVVITTETSAAAGATSIADLKPLLIGAQVGTTSFDAIEQQIQPDAGAQVFNTNDDAKLALEAGQVDAIVVDLPTAFYLTGVELTGGLIVGQLPKPDGKSGDEFGLVLAKDSPLTADVTAAVDALRDSGKLDEIAAQWLADAGNAPVLH